MTLEADQYILKVGSKGEIFPPKEIRKKLGLKPDQPISMTVQNDKLIIKKIYSIEEILKTPPKTKISYHAWKQFKKDLSEDLEK
jgi:AbrB family looped-hinge helix DNA binding protein